MTNLLVSVRSAAEAHVALAGGADVIDVKEPSRGALGAADVQVWQAVVSAVAARATTSVALGELASGLVKELAPHASGFAFAKIGLAGCAGAAWHNHWQQAAKCLPRDVRAVSVAYADWRQSQAPSPLDVLHHAAQASQLLVLDTCDKSGGSLLDHLPLPVLADFMATASSLGVKITLAGSLTTPLISDVLSLRPAYIGVRGAACSGGRQGKIDLQRVRDLATLLHGESVKSLANVD